VAAVMSFAAASTAGATARVRVYGGTRLRGTSSRLAVTNTPDGTQYHCGGSRMHINAREHTTGAAYPVRFAHRVRLSLTSCTMPGTSLTVNCSHSKLAVSGVTVAGRTPGFIEGIDCTIDLPVFGGSCRTRMVGAQGVSYTNSGWLTVDRFHNSLQLTGTVTGGLCPLHNSTSLRFSGANTNSNAQYTIAPAVSINAS
jgi:hypothetical protein